MFQLTKKELALFRRLHSPSKIQDYLNSLPFNFEAQGNTLRSPRMVLRTKTAHCLEGALFAAAALLVHGQKPLLLDLRPNKKKDDGHVVALYRVHGYWGAISKTNHAVLRFRDPIYRTIRELALSYFHEYFLNTNGEKTLIGYAGPYDLSKLGVSWLTSADDLFYLNKKLDTLSSHPFVPDINKRYVRRADPVERRLGEIVEWKPKKKIL